VTNPAPPAAGIFTVAEYAYVTPTAATTHSVPPGSAPPQVGKMAICFAAIDFATSAAPALTGVQNAQSTRLGPTPGVAMLSGTMAPDPLHFPAAPLGDSDTVAHTAVHAGVLMDWDATKWTTIVSPAFSALATNPGQTFINTTGSGGAKNIVAFAYHEAAARTYNLAGIPNVTIIGQHGPDTAGVRLDLLMVDGNIPITGIPFTPALVNHALSAMATVWPQTDLVTPPTRLGPATCPCLAGFHDQLVNQGVQNPSVLP